MKKSSLVLSCIRNPVLAAVAGITVLQMAAAEQASAQFAGGALNAGQVAKNLIEQLGSIGKVCLGGAFLMGIGMIAQGFLKLKQAADTQGQQVKYGEGLWRLAAGTGLVAIPSVAGVLSATVGFQQPTMSIPTIF